MITLDNFLSQKIIIENTGHADLLYLIPDSNNHNIAYGFLKHGIPYIIRLVEITNTVSSGLWELKISKLKYAKDLKEYKSDQASMDKHSLEYYLQAIEFVFNRLPAAIKIKIKGLIFNLPQTTTSDVIPFLRKKLTILFKHSIPALNKIESPLKSNVYKWIFSYKGQLEDIFTEHTSIDNFNILTAVNSVFAFPTTYKPLRTIKRITDFSQFPEIENREIVDELFLPSNLNFIQQFIDIKEVLNKQFENPNHFIDTNKQKPLINYFASADVFEDMLDQITEEEISIGRQTRIRQTKKYYDFILDKLNSPIQSNFLATFIKQCENYFKQNNSTSELDNIEKQLDHYGLFQFLSFCRNFVLEIKQKPSLAKSIEREPFILSDKPYIKNLNDDSNQFEEKFKLLAGDNFENKEDVIIGGKIKFFNEINYSLHSTYFREQLYKYKNSFVNYTNDNNDYSISFLMKTKRLFDEFIRIFNQSFERGVREVFDQFRTNKISHLRKFSPEFYDWFINLINLQENEKNINFRKDLFFKEKIYNFEFSPDYNFIDQFTSLDNDKSLEQKTFNVILKLFCKENKIDVEKIYFASELEKITDEIINQFKISQIFIEDKIDDSVNPKLLVLQFKHWMKSWFEKEKDNKAKQSNIKMSDSKFMNYVKEQLENPNDKNRLDILNYKKKVVSSTVLSNSLVSSLPFHEVKKILKSFEKAYNPVIAATSHDYDHTNKDAELKEFFQYIWKHSDYREVINNYTRDPVANSFFRGKNHYALNTALSQVKPFLDPILESFDENIVTIRGSKSDKWLANNIAGDYVVEPGFLSTSISFDSASEFSSTTGIYYLFYIPKGTKFLYVEEVSSIKTEYEVLLPPGTVFRILSIENRASASNETLHGTSGLVYSLLLVNTITESICEELFDQSDVWKEFKKYLNG